MSAKTIFLIIWFIVFVFIVTTLYKKGKKVLSIFPDVNSHDIKYRYKYASGYSKIGGARNCLDIVVINNELWIKSMVLFAFIGKKNDLLHRIPLNSIYNAEKRADEIIIDFKSEIGENKQIVIKTQRPDEFLISIKSIFKSNNEYTVTSNLNSVLEISKRKKYYLIIILAVICWIIVFLQYQNQKNKHDRFSTIGQVTKIISSRYTSLGVDYVNYYFITSKGQKIEGSEKLGNNEYSKYVNATAIYNPINPMEYQLSFDYESYYPIWRIFFFFFLYFPIMTFIAYRYIQFGVLIYQKFKRK